jgi:alanyl-tRNA synthetase
VQAEEEKYLSTLASGARRVQEAIDRTREAGGDALSGEEVFRLYDTYGLEVATVQEIAEEEKLGIDEAGFQKALEASQEKARVGTREKQQRMASLRDALAGGDATAFGGYGEHRLEGARVQRLAGLGDGGKAASAEALEQGRSGVAVVDRTVFYAESGGQVGDRGTITWDGGRARVIDTQKDTAGTTFHFLDVEEGRLEAGAEVTLQVDGEARAATERHHTATHLLHAALHEVVGENARQAGSLVEPGRLRFDFTHGQPLTAAEITQVEDIVNAWVRKSVPAEIRERSKEEAMAAGAMALFGEKYGDTVRTVEIPGFSLELCGGCHVRNTGEIGLFLVTGERGTASGVRRLEAITGEVAYAEVRRQQATLHEVAAALNVADDRVAVEAAAARERVKALEKEVADLRRQLVSGASADRGETEVDGVKVMAREVPKAPRNELRNLADTLRDKMGSGVVVLATQDDGKVSLIATVSKDLVGRLKAGNLVKSLAPIVGGKGGGRPDFAQAGGKDPSKLPELLAAVPGVVGEQLAA